MRQRLIKLLGGYTKDEVLTEAVKDLFNTIGADDILQEKGGVWMVGGKAMNDGEKNLLISQASSLMGMKLWKVLQEDIKFLANQRMFLRSQSQMDLIAGKLWLYTLDSIKTRLESLSKGSGRFNSDA